MAALRKVNGKYEACCDYCGVWREVQLRPVPGDIFFAHFQADFLCCGVPQTAQWTLEKDELDFH